MITITGKALGQRKPLFADFSVPVPPLNKDNDITLRDFIAHIVRHEVAAFKERQEEKRFIKALSAKQIAEAVQKGKVDMGGHEEAVQTVDPEVAVATALEAFSDGLFLAILDGEERTDLDAVLHLTETSQVTFVRLTMLAGG
jgi:hypothetical protein